MEFYRKQHKTIQIAV